MSSPAGSYDTGLLASAPVATRAARQGGYDVDLLDKDPYNGRPSASSSRHTLPRSPITPVQAEQVYPYKEEHVIPGQRRGKPPFWRTGRGIAIIIIVAIVILGAVIGGAVGGTVGRHKSNNAATSPSSAPAQSDSSVASSSTSIPSAPDSGNGTTVSGGGARIGTATTSASGGAAADPTTSPNGNGGTQAFATDL